MVDDNSYRGNAPSKYSFSRRKFIGALSVGMAALAGCSGGNDSSATTTTTTTTTAPTTTETTTTTTETGPTLESVSFPDGVTESSVTENLLLAQKLATSGTAYTIQTEYSGPYETSQTTIQLGINKAAQKQVAVQGSTKSFWKNGTVGYCKVNGGAYYYHCNPTVNREQIASYRRISTQIQLGNYSPTSVKEQDGTTLITAKASSASIPKELSHRYEEIKSYTGTLTFTPEGVIRYLSYKMTAVQPWDDQAETVEFSWKASKIGNTTVSTPTWVSTAKKQAFDFEVKGLPEKDYVTVDVVAGSGTLPSNLWVSLDGSNGHYNADPRIGLKKGDTLYIAPLSNGKLGVSVGEPPTGRASVSGTWSLRVQANGPTVIDTSVSL